MDKYEILHITSAHKAKDGRIFYKEALSAASIGFRVGVVGDNEVEETIGGVDIIPVKKSTNRLLRRIIGPVKLLSVVLKYRPKIVHFHDPEIIPMGYILMFLGYKVVYDMHEYYSEIQSLRVKNKFLNWVIKRIVKIFIEQIPCRIFSATVFPTNKLREEFLITKKTVAILNLLPKKLIPSNDINGKKTFDLVFMGTISPFRAKPLIEMMEIILCAKPDAKLLMLGTKNETKDWIKKNAKKEVFESIFFHESVEHKDVAKILQSAKIGFNFHPEEKRFEVAIPMKIYEYMSCKLAVVTTSFPELENQFSNEREIIMIKGEDQKIYARAILDILNNDAKATYLGENGYNAIINRVNWDLSEIPKLKKLYQGLLSKK